MTCFGSRVLEKSMYDEAIWKLVYAGELIVIKSIYDFKDIYSAKKGSIFIINATGEIDVEKLKSIDFLAGRRS